MDRLDIRGALSPILKAVPPSTAPPRADIAPWHVVPATQVISVEHPCVVKNVEKALRMLGGDRELAKVIQRPPEPWPVEVSDTNAGRVGGGWSARRWPSRPAASSRGPAMQAHRNQGYGDEQRPTQDHRPPKDRSEEEEGLLRTVQGRARRS